MCLLFSDKLLPTKMVGIDGYRLLEEAVTAKVDPVEAPIGEAGHQGILKDHYSAMIMMGKRRKTLQP